MGKQTSSYINKKGQTVEVEHMKLDYIAAREIVRLEDILANDIPSVYESFDSFLYDFGPDFSWNMYGAQVEYQSLLNNKEWLDLAQKVKDKRGYDFVKTVQEHYEYCRDAEY